MLREDSKDLRGGESRAERLHAKDLLCVSNSLLRAMISSDCLVFTCVAATKSRDRSRVFRLASKRVLVVDSSIASPPDGLDAELLVLRQTSSNVAEP